MTVTDLNLKYHQMSNNLDPNLDQSFFFSPDLGLKWLTCADPESFVKGGPTLTTFFFVICI